MNKEADILHITTLEPHRYRFYRRDCLFLKKEKYTGNDKIIVNKIIKSQDAI